jgi:hypothetical protein
LSLYAEEICGSTGTPEKAILTVQVKIVKKQFSSVPVVTLFYKMSFLFLSQKFFCFFCRSKNTLLLIKEEVAKYAAVDNPLFARKL